MKTKLIFISIFLLFTLSNITKSQTYFSDGVEVPIFEGTIIPNVTTKFVNWDLGEVNTVNNRLDIVAGVSQKGYNGGSGNYIIGNWYYNQYNDNFNSEVIDNRFIAAFNYSNPITGLILAKLNTSSNYKKSVVISRYNGQIEIYSNSSGSISYLTTFTANSTVAAIGNFTTGDNLEDVAVIREDTVKIYKNLGNGYLDSIPVFRLANVHASKVIIAQVNSWIEPYATVKETTSNKDDIILLQGDSIRIYNNDNNNSASLSTIIYTGSAYSVYGDFKVADLNNDGFNDLVIVEEDYGINVYKNSSGTINTTPTYRNVNEPYFHTFSVAVGDFDKNGWNDIAVTLVSQLNLYLNNKGDSLFNQTASESFLYDFPIRTSCNPLKTTVADLYNKGGLAVVFSNIGNVQELSPEDPLNEIEQVARINANDTDAVPAPAIIFGEAVYINYHNRPKLLLFDRDNRDFLRFRIYKKSPYVSNVWTLIDSTSNDYYIDYNETVVGGSPETNNTFYYAKVVDNSYKVSINSDTIGLETVCPSCGSEGRLFVGNETPTEYSITNYPNPFNPSTKIYYTLPVEGNVKIEVFNTIGQKVKELSNEFMQAGAYTIEFDGANFSSGIYYYKIESRNFVATKRMLLLK